MEILIAALCGAMIGSIIGLVGAGGSMIAVPMLIYIFDFTPVQATTASLLIVFAGATSGLTSKIKSRDVLVRDGLVIWFIGLGTNFAGAYLLPRLSEAFILTGFSLVLISAGVSMLLKQVPQRPERRMSVIALVALSLLIGAMTGLFGIGGGFVAIPVLILFYNVSPSKAAGTSLFIIMINTLTGFFAHARHWGEVPWSLPITIAVSALLISRLAAQQSRRFKTVTLKRWFAGTVFAIAFLTLLETWT